MSILLVDDSRTMRMIVTRTLRQAGYGDHEIIEASNGKEGLEAVDAQQPTLILSDWNMPEMNGIEFLATLRERGDVTPFGFVTSESSPGMRDIATTAGALFLIGKPFTADTFADALSTVLS